ncbi:MAG TPA: LacI family DNA-binding transcriptional regulator [Ktedonobacteraceae bacterium]|jgi:DNA-binding LacI/PurR family transcriptional regulator|nr:LacI family DNA-binding transcriptional regulator [Ktedonobacteraceae bacterium]
MATSEEVAHYADVTHATVSQALHESARVKSETRAIVQFIVHQSTGPAPREEE